MTYLSRIILLPICLVVISSESFVSAQIRVTKQYLRHSMIFFEDAVPRVTPTEITFLRDGDCGLSEDPYGSPILRRGTQVEIVSIDKARKPAIVVFRSGSKEFMIQLENSSRTSLEKSFHLAFADKALEFGSGFAKDWKTVIKKYGFPISKCLDSGIEKWFYIIEFAPACGGAFDGCNLWMTTKGIEMSGYI